MANDIEALREHLFDTLKSLKSVEVGHLEREIERAKSVCQVGAVIIESAKAEIDFARVNGSVDTKFFQRLNGTMQSKQALAKPAGEFDFEDEDLPIGSGKETHSTPTGTVTRDHRNGQVITTHKIK